MKNSFIILAIALFFSFTTASAQSQTSTGKHDFRITYSDATTLKFGSELADILGTNLASAVTGGNGFKIKDSKAIGMLGLRYTYQFSDRFRAGLDAGYLKMDRTLVEKDKSDNPTVYKSNQHVIVVMPTAEFSYIKTSFINFYGSASAGGMLIATPDQPKEKIKGGTDMSFAFQVNPLGLRIGKQFGGFAELGFGHKGIATVGISYQF